MKQSMRLLRSFAWIWVLWTASLPAWGSETLFAEANARYERGDFKTALEGYQSVLEGGQESAALYYNMGNCYVRLGQKAEAIWAYEKARRLDPRDPDIRWNQRVVSKQLADKKEAKLDALQVTHIRALLDRLTARELAMAFSFSAGLALVLLIAGAGFAVLRGGILKGTGFLLVLLALTGGAAALRAHEIKTPQAVLREKEIYARYGPSKEATRAFVLHEGTTVTVLKEGQGWSFVGFGDTQRGWVPNDSLLRF